MMKALFYIESSVNRLQRHSSRDQINEGVSHAGARGVKRQNGQALRREQSCHIRKPEVKPVSWLQSEGASSERFTGPRA